MNSQRNNNMIDKIPLKVTISKEEPIIVPPMDKEMFLRESERIRPIKKAFSNLYLKNPYIATISIGTKKGVDREEIAITLTLKGDLSKGIPAEYRIPETFDGIPVIIMGGSSIIQCTDNSRNRPAEGGRSISAWNMPAGYGTLGCWVDGSDIGEISGEKFLITNYHVLPKGTSIVLQPGSYQPHDGTYDIVFNGANIVAYWWKGVRSNLVDVAVAKPLDPGRGTPTGPTTQLQIVDIGTCGSFGTAAVNNLVQKRGATSGRTYGRVRDIAFDMTSDEHSMDDQIQVSTMDAQSNDVFYFFTGTQQQGIGPLQYTGNLNQRFMQPGDSGSMLVQNVAISPNIYGLLHSATKYDEHWTDGQIAWYLSHWDIQGTAGWQFVSWTWDPQQQAWILNLTWNNNLRTIWQFCGYASHWDDVADALENEVPYKVDL